GPSSPGVAVDNLSWRWGFLGAAVLVGVVAGGFVPRLRHLPAHDGDRERPRGTRGLALAAVGTGTAVAVLQVAGSAQEGWSVPAVVAAVVVLALLLPRLLPRGTPRLALEIGRAHV